ncbi:MAG: GTPase Era [Gemmatimonadota bacterium]
MSKAGFVAVVGRPNAGKSTLLNALVGERLAIVTPKAQTTRRRMTGILTSGEVQWIFVDTPGLLTPRTLFDRSLLEAARLSVRDADVVLALLDGSGESPEDLDRLRDALIDCGRPIVAAVSKGDVADPATVRQLTRWAEQTLAPQAVHVVSAPRAEGLSDLLGSLASCLPEGPHLFPADELSSESLRDLVAELVRETVLQQYRQEIPYAVVCAVEEFRESETPVYIQVTVYVERDSQKRILIGSKGAGIRELGIEARRKVEDLIGRPVYLDLWVKVLKDWRKKAEQLQRFGFVLPEGGAP